jgi:hypothetical protein
VSTAALTSVLTTHLHSNDERAGRARTAHDHGNGFIAYSPPLRGP